MTAKRSPSSSQLYGRWRFIVILEQRSTTRCGIVSFVVFGAKRSKGSCSLKATSPSRKQWRSPCPRRQPRATHQRWAQASTWDPRGQLRAKQRQQAWIEFRLTRGHAAAAHTNIRVDLLAQERVGTLRVIRGRENVVTGVETKDTSLRTAHTRTKPAIPAVSEAICQAHVEAKTPRSPSNALRRWWSTWSNRSPFLKRNQLTHRHSMATVFSTLAVGPPNKLERQQRLSCCHLPWTVRRWKWNWTLAPPSRWWWSSSGIVFLHAPLWLPRPSLSARTQASTSMSTAKQPFALATQGRNTHCHWWSWMERAQLSSDETGCRPSSSTGLKSSRWLLRLVTQTSPLATPKSLPKAWARCRPRRNFRWATMRSRSFSSHVPFPMLYVQRLATNWTDWRLQESWNRFPSAIGPRLSCVSGRATALFVCVATTKSPSTQLWVWISTPSTSRRAFTQPGRRHRLLRPRHDECIPADGVSRGLSCVHHDQHGSWTVPVHAPTFRHCIRSGNLPTSHGSDHTRIARGGGLHWWHSRHWSHPSRARQQPERPDATTPGEWSTTLPREVQAQPVIGGVPRFPHRRRRCPRRNIEGSSRPSGAGAEGYLAAPIFPWPDQLPCEVHQESEHDAAPSVRAAETWHPMEVVRALSESLRRRKERLSKPRCLGALRPQVARATCHRCLTLWRWCCAHACHARWSGTPCCVCLPRSQSKRAELLSAGPRGPRDNLRCEEVSHVPVWPTFHPDHRPQASNLHLQPHKRHTIDGSGSPATVVHRSGLLRLRHRVPVVCQQRQCGRNVTPTPGPGRRRLVRHGRRDLPHACRVYTARHGYPTGYRHSAWSDPCPGAPLDTLRLAFDATQRDVPAVQSSTARVIDRRRMPPMGSSGGCTCRPSSRRSSDAARTAPWHVSDESDCAQPCVVAVPGYRYRRAGPILLTLPTGPAGAHEGSAFSMGASSSSLATAPHWLRRARRSVVFPPRWRLFEMARDRAHDEDNYVSNHHSFAPHIFDARITRSYCIRQWPPVYLWWIQHVPGGKRHSTHPQLTVSSGFQRRRGTSSPVLQVCDEKERDLTEHRTQGHSFSSCYTAALRTPQPPGHPASSWCHAVCAHEWIYSIRNWGRMSSANKTGNAVRTTHGQQCNVTYRKPGQDFAWFKSCCLTLFYPDHFVQRSTKLLFLLFVLKNKRSVKATSSDSALVW